MDTTAYSRHLREPVVQADLAGPSCVIKWAIFPKCRQIMDVRGFRKRPVGDFAEPSAH